jgi:hypothetical protein
LGSAGVAWIFAGASLGAFGACGATFAYGASGAAGTGGGFWPHAWKGKSVAKTKTIIARLKVDGPIISMVAASF